MFEWLLHIVFNEIQNMLVLHLVVIKVGRLTNTLDIVTFKIMLIRSSASRSH